MNNRIPVYKPSISSLSIENVNDALTTNWISWRGNYVNEAIARLRKLCGVEHIVLTCNGTAATHCIFRALRFKHPECHKIYVPNHSYIAVWNTALQEYRADEIEALDADIITFNTDFSQIDALEKGACVLIVHHFSGIVDVPALQEQRPDLIFIEDNCEGFLGQYSNGHPSGSASLCSSISFFANKTMTSGEGGAFCTNDPDVYEYIYKYCHQGVTKQQYVHDMFATNYRMTNIQAAIICGQLDGVEKTMEKKKALFMWYKNAYKKMCQDASITKDNVFFQEDNSMSSYWMCACVIHHPGHTGYTQVEKAFNDQGIETRPFFYPITKHPHMYAVSSPRNNCAKYLSRRGLVLPSYPELMDDGNARQLIMDTLIYYIRNL